MVAFRKLDLLTTLCALVSIFGYLWDGSVPILMIGPRSTTQLHKSGRQVCISGSVSNTTAILQHNDSIPAPFEFIVEGPSKVEELVPLRVLKKKLSQDPVKGLSYLDHASLSRYYRCRTSKKLLLSENASTDNTCTDLSFRNKETPIIALVSFHGSGNTWVRHLLEQSTGIYTGSIYCDRTLKSVFRGESVVSGNVVAVKTHHADSRELPIDTQLATRKRFYDKVILLVRDPFDALVSEANRRWNSEFSIDQHLGLADETAFISNSRWDWYVEYKGMAWALLLHTWLSTSENGTTTPVHIVQYENLLADLRGEMIKILKFLDFEVSEQILDCVVRNSAGRFKRSHHLNFNPYTQENKEAVNRYIRQAAPILARHGITYNTR